MPGYGPGQSDNWQMEAILTYEEAMEQDIVSNWDLLLARGEFPIRKYDSRTGGELQWKLKVNRPQPFPSTYPIPDFVYTPVQQMIIAHLPFTDHTEPMTIPWGEQLRMDAMAPGTPGLVDLQAREQVDGKDSMQEYFDGQFWNGSSVDYWTGLDAAIDDVAGTATYAGVSRAAQPRWQANVNANAFTLWYGTVATQIVPLWLYSRVLGGKKPNKLVCPMAAFTAFVFMMANRQVSEATNPRAKPMGMYVADIGVLNMDIIWGGPDMPNETDLFGLRSDDIQIRYLGRNFFHWEPWEMYQNNNWYIARYLNSSQLQVGSPEGHFRVKNMTVPDNPTEEPEVS